MLDLCIIWLEYGRPGNTVTNDAFTLHNRGDSLQNNRDIGFLTSLAQVHLGRFERW